MWLQWNPNIKNYVIVDDRTDMMDHQLSHFVKVNPYTGLTDENIEQALNILLNDN